jgi:hypothetical protein
MNELVIALLAWIGLQTGLPVPPPPQIEMVSEQAMMKLTSLPFAVRGAFDSETATVYLRDDWKAGDLRSGVTLLHELVHHVQVRAAIPVRCPAEREVQAYNLSVKWLEQRGVRDPYAFLEIDEFTVFVFSQCPED